MQTYKILDCEGYCLHWRVREETALEATDCSTLDEFLDYCDERGYSVIDEQTNKAINK